MHGGFSQAIALIKPLISDCVVFEKKVLKNGQKSKILSFPRVMTFFKTIYNNLYNWKTIIFRHYPCI